MQLGIPVGLRGEALVNHQHGKASGRGGSGIRARALPSPGVVSERRGVGGWKPVGKGAARSLWVPKVAWGCCVLVRLDCSALKGCLEQPVRVGYAAPRLRRGLSERLFARLTPPYEERFGEPYRLCEGRRRFGRAGETREFTEPPDAQR